MTIRALALLAVVVTLPAALAGPPAGADPPGKEPAGGPAQRIKTLQTERLATLKTLVKTYDTLVRLPRARPPYIFGEAVDATQLLLRAELETTQKGTDRLALYQEAIARLKRYEDQANAFVREGEGATELSVRLIQAQRLVFEIQSEQLRLKDAAAVAHRPAPPEPPKDGAKSPAQEPAGGPAQKIKELQKERIEILEGLLKQTVADWRLPRKGSRASHEDVLKLQSQLLEAKLEAAEKVSDRIPIYTQAVEILKRCEETAQANWSAARDSVAPVLRFKAERLGIEIRLERAKMEAKAGR